MFSKPSSSSSSNTSRMLCNCMIQIEDDSQRLPQKDLFDQLLEDAGQNSNLRMHSLLCQTMENGVGVEQVELDQNVVAHAGCKCSKIDCLKLYCECFAKGRPCTSRCVCVCCHNQPTNTIQIFKAKQIANYRNPGYFKGIPALQPIRRCTCKKSSCRKNYCECYRNGEKCTQDCYCIDCHNGKLHEHYDQWNITGESLVEVNA